MKTSVFLRNHETHEYYAGIASWVCDQAGAYDFNNVETAVQLALEQKLDGLEIVLRYDDPACDLVVPVRRNW